MVKYYNEDEMIFRHSKDGIPFPVCPDCIGHDNSRGADCEWHDCKNIYITAKGHYGQCCCYSKEHGDRQ